MVHLQAPKRTVTVILRPHLEAITLCMKFLALGKFRSSKMWKRNRLGKYCTALFFHLNHNYTIKHDEIVKKEINDESS